MLRYIIIAAVVGIALVGIGFGFSAEPVKVGEMSEVQSAITSAAIGLGTALNLVDPDPQVTGDEFFQNIIELCKFHSDESITTDTCVICKLADAAGNVVAEGFLDLPGGYTGSDTLQVPITDIHLPGGNDVQVVHKVRLEVCETGEGCTPGFWKNHLDSWPDPYDPEDNFKETFGLDPDPADPVVIQFENDPISNPTLFQAVSAQGGALNALARHAVAALLNAQSAIAYPLTPAEVISNFQAAYDSGDFETTKNQFEGFNEAGCPFGGDNTTSESASEEQFSLTGNVDTTTTVVQNDTPWQKKQYSLNQLNGLLTQTNNQETIANLNDAINYLNAALVPDYWVNDYHLSVTSGEIVLQNSKQATNSLVIILTFADESQTFKDSIQAVIDNLIAADMILAQTAIDDVAACGEENPTIAGHLDRAQQQLTAAQSDSNLKKYTSAIEKFYQAWHEAFLATQSCPTGYWTQFEGYSVVEVN